MSLFDVPGWTVPAAPVTQQASRKRKRPAGKDEDKVHTAEINFEKLMAKLEAGTDVAQQSHSKKQQQTQRKKKGKKDAHAARPTGKDSAPPHARAKIADSSRNVAQPKDVKTNVLPDTPSASAEPNSSKKRRKKAREHASSREPQGAVSTTGARQSSQPKEELTALQRGLKNSLDGARFRWINEQLYKSDSGHAHEMLRENPEVFEEASSIFLADQPRSTHYITVLSSYPLKTVVADLGCGDAALARALVPKGMTVLSFDLVSDGAFVIEADTCARLPFPGSEGSSVTAQDDEASEGEGSVVDVVVCALSLMGTNWPNCIREAWRVLRPSGELKIAEVASRFTDVDDFVSLVCSFGFLLKAKDDRNTHFTLFDFKRVPRKAKSQKEWSKLLSRGSVLKPCEYKRR